MSITYQPQVWDVRADDAGSLSVLPKLNKGDWDKLKDFMQSHWPEFDIIGTYGEERAQPGQRWWAIGAIEVKEGPAVFQIQFRKDEATYDDGNILSFCSWPGAPSIPIGGENGFNPEVDVIYDAHGIYDFSEGADSKGYPHGSESGPYKFWLNSDPGPSHPDFPDPRVGSDAMIGVHWFENHVCCNAVLWPMRKPGTAPPAGTEYLVNIRDGQQVGHIPFVPGPPGAGNDALGLMRDGEVVGHVAWQ